MKTITARKWLPPGDDGSVSPAMAHLKHQSAVISLLGHRAREGLDPESEDPELALEQYMPTSLELEALWPESLRPLGRGKNQSKEPERPLPPLGPVTVDPKGGVSIAIHAKPGSKQNAVTDVTAEAVSVAIAAPPTEGEANAELCRYLSKVLELRKSDVVLDKGGKSREKVVKLLASTPPEEILEKLKKQVEKK
ncbi:hypothetical protein JEQ12_007758 [Ovis aries]|uniref:Uncharacterized protein n=1 Tax=Ovis aries TaxID=9940 RepID=A0A836CUJ3_SHEEP|nr:hypothetical protein JEQ12_007758 [Ovis aries]